jgi:hypothetical protein
VNPSNVLSFAVLLSVDFFVFFIAGLLLYEP